LRRARGEILDAGGKVLSKDAATKLVAAATVSGATPGGGQFQSDYKADGTFTGTLQTAQGKGRGRLGTWTIDDHGLFCSETTTVGYGSSESKDCACVLTLAGKYFVAFDSNERGTRVLERNIKR
jgi:hypothetical protein